MRREIWVSKPVGTVMVHVRDLRVDPAWRPDRFPEPSKDCHTTLTGVFTPCTCGEVTWCRGIRAGRLES